MPTRGFDAYLMVYSIADHDSFDDAILSLYELRKSTTAAAVILVANKADMVRHRKVTQEGEKQTDVRNIQYAMTNGLPKRGKKYHASATNNGCY